MNRTLGVLVTAVVLLVSAGSANASYPGENGRIAAPFTRNESTEFCGNPPDPACVGGSFGELRLLPFRGRGMRTIARCSGQCSFGRISWSRSGRRVAFADSDFRIYVANANGSRARLVNGAVGEDPVWSPDGKSLAFISAGRLSVVPVRGGEPQLIAPHKVHRDSDPSWCPGGRIVFTRVTGLGYQLWSVFPDGRGKRRLTKAVLPAGDCGRGDMVLYSTLDATRMQRADGRGKPRRLFGRRLGSPVLSPDGREIVYLNQGIWRSKLDGSGEQRLYRNGEREFWGEPSWQPLRRR